MTLRRAMCTAALAVVLVGVLGCGRALARGTRRAPQAHAAAAAPIDPGHHGPSRRQRALQRLPGAHRAGSLVRGAQRRLWQWRRPELRTLVLDFDGTMTDVAREARGFVDAHRQLLQQRTGLSDEQLRRVLDEARRRVDGNPQEGWRRELEAADPRARGKSVVVAPATADPYVTTNAVTREAIAIAAERGWLSPARLARSGGATVANPEPLLEELFSAAYKKSGTAFRPGAARFLDAASRRYRVVIVTNSDTRGVLAKLEQLAAASGLQHLREIPVYGDARKFAPTPDYDAVPHTLQLPGQQRPVYLRRGRYGKLLVEQLKLDPRRSAVVGDIPELDLYLPLALGFRRAILIKNDFSRELDVRYLKAHERGGVSDDFTGVLRALEQAAPKEHLRRGR